MFGLNILSANMQQLLYCCFFSSMHTDYKMISFYFGTVLKYLDKFCLISNLLIVSIARGRAGVGGRRPKKFKATFRLPTQPSSNK